MPADGWIAVRRATLVLALLAGTAAPAFAYGGPGSVISGIGALLATAAAIVAAVLGFLWFPLKRLWRRLRRGAGRATPPEDAGAG